MDILQYLITYRREVEVRGEAVYLLDAIEMQNVG